MSFFRSLTDRVRDGLRRTRELMDDGLDALLAVGRPVDEALLQELEEILIVSDLGPETATAFVQRVRTMDLFKAPGVAETIDWTRSLMALDALTLEPGVVADTLGALLKYQDDIARFSPEHIAELVDEARTGIAA